MNTVTLAYRDWLPLPAAENGADEVVNGELRLVPTRLHPNAQVYGSGIGLMISRGPHTCRSPDIAVFWREKDWSAPDLIVEVLSPSENRRRKEEKLADYAAIGAPEVWLVSPEAETVEIRLLKERKLERDGDSGRRIAATLAICRSYHFRPSHLSGVNP